MANPGPTNRSMAARAITLAKDDLAVYAALSWPRFELAAHHRLIVEHLEKVESGAIDRLVITCPPRHGKSLITSQIFPAWYLGRHPERSIIACSYGSELALDFGRHVRNRVTDSLHRRVFPGCSIATDNAASHRFSTLSGGSYFALGAGGPVTGRGCDVLIVDDPVKSSADAASAAERRSLQSWFENVAYTRLTASGAIVLIQGIFNRNWWCFYEPAALPVRFEQVLVSIDSAFKVGSSNDYSVALTLGVAKDGYYILDVLRQRLEFPELKRAVVALAARWSPNVILIEDKASGMSLVQELQNETRLPIKPIKIDRDKISRANAVTPLVEARRVYLPRNAHWLADFLDEVSSFPAAPHDDMVDALSQALNHVRRSGGSEYDVFYGDITEGLQWLQGGGATPEDLPAWDIGVTDPSGALLPEVQAFKDRLARMREDRERGIDTTSILYRS
jgi:predicted phage terminase large subunit-like protein